MVCAPIYQNAYFVLRRVRGGDGTAGRDYPGPGEERESVLVPGYICISQSSHLYEYSRCGDVCILTVPYNHHLILQIPGRHPGDVKCYWRVVHDFPRVININPSTKATGTLPGADLLPNFRRRMSVFLSASWIGISSIGVVD